MVALLLGEIVPEVAGYAQHLVACFAGRKQLLGAIWVTELIFLRVEHDEVKLHTGHALESTACDRKVLVRNADTGWM